MKKSTYIMAMVVTALLLISQVTICAQTLVSQWGNTPRGTAWPILNTATTPAGNASYGADAKPSAWASMKGGFNTITPTLTQAIVVSGTFELVGGGANNAYTWLRYALTYQDNPTLNNQNTPTAAWVGGNHWGYQFTPRTGVGELANGGGGSGVVWTVNNSGGWNSTYSNNGGPLVTVLQAPTRAVATAGVYDWAISVQPLADGTNEIRWYFVKQYAAGKQSDYWCAGIAIDKTPVTTKFNSICFSNNNDLDATCKQVNLTKVTVGLGNPITIPDAPWQAYYVDAWGNTTNGTAWPILNTADYTVGNASMGADAKPTGWATIKGGFKESHTPTLKKALIISGTYEMVGGGANNAYTWLRFALTYQDSAVFKDQYKTTANWTGKKHWGYEFTPRTGVGEIANGAGGSGTLWTIKNGNWNSTWSNNGGPVSTVLQAPSRAIATAGVYDWAISMQPLADGSMEIRWYFVKKAAAGKQSDYWFGGTYIDKNPTTTKFNGICFGVNNDLDATCKQVNINDVKIDMGNPITVPEAPWQSYYVDAWGNTPQGTAWPILNTADYMVGNASFGSTGKPTGWTTIKGGFREAHTPTLKKALVVTGTYEMVGGGGNNAYTWLRFALTYQDSAVFKDQNKPTANWTGKKHWGYQFTPRTGVGEIANGAGGSGTVWTVKDGNWNSTWSNNGGPIITIDQVPLRAVAKAGIYNWAVSVQPLADGTNEIRWYFVKKADAGKQSEYWFGGTVIDKNQIATKFNGILFGLNNDVDATLKQVNINDVKVDMIEQPLVIPEAPWQPFYVDTWGILGQRRGGWLVKPQDVIGNVTVQGKEPAIDFVVLRGQFPSGVTPTSKSLLISANVELVGGGFEPWGSFRYGLFEGTSGKVDSTNGLYTWTGAENNHSGYIFFPPSGTKDLAYWVAANKNGSFGGIFSGIPIYNHGPNDYPVGTANTSSPKIMSRPGVYDLRISITPLADGTAEIRHYLITKDKKYYWADKAIDKAKPRATNRFNSVVFALGPTPSTTALKITDFKVDMGNAITLPVDTDVKEEINSGVPTEFALDQNYPNPFNPTTTIEFALPQNSNVKMIVYDVLGKEVAELVNGNMTAGYHKVNFNASNLSSGVYFYSIKAGDFTSVKKLVLMK